MFDGVGMEGAENADQKMQELLQNTANLFSYMGVSNNCKNTTPSNASDQLVAYSVIDLCPVL